jgi:hypothetical protein
MHDVRTKVVLKTSRTHLLLVLGDTPLPIGEYGPPMVVNKDGHGVVGYGEHDIRLTTWHNSSSHSVLYNYRNPYG